MNQAQTTGKNLPPPLPPFDGGPYNLPRSFATALAHLNVHAAARPLGPLPGIRPKARVSDSPEPKPGPAKRAKLPTFTSTAKYWY